MSEMDTAGVPWTRRLGQLLVALLGCRRRRRPGRSAEAAGEDRRDPRPRRRRRPLAAPRRRDGALEPRGPPGGRGARPRRSRLLGTARRSIRPTPTTASPRRPPTASSSTSAPSRSSRRRARCDVLDYVTVHDAGRLLNPLLADGQVLGGFAHGVAAALYERHVYDEWGNLMTASLVDYLAPTAPDIPRAPDRPPSRRRRR